MSDKVYCGNISTRHTDNKLSFLPQKRGKKYILSMIFYILNSFFPFKFHIAKMHISCSFSETKYLFVLTKNVLCKLPIPKRCQNVMLRQFWSEDADLITKA